MGWDGWVGSGLEENGNYVGVSQTLGITFHFFFSGGGLGAREEITILLTNSPSLPVDVS